MAMQKIKKLVAITGTYEKNGQTKNQYITCGSLFQRDDGSLCMKLDALPLGDFNGWINAYDLDENRAENNANGMAQVKQETGIAPNSGSDFDSDVPF